MKAVLLPGGVEYIYLVEVWADRLVALKGIDIVSVNGQITLAGLQ